MGTFIFPKAPVYSWYLSATAIPLNISWCLHNVISWIKIKPFLSKRWSYVFIGTVVLSFPYWIIEIYANFTYFNNVNEWFLTTRPYEAIFRDPWWIFTTAYLFYQIGAHYRIKLTTLVIISPRFGMLLFSMLLSIAFIVLDICSVTHVFDSALPDGLNPFWKLSTVFKLLCDSIILDDFKTALDRLMRHKMRREGMARMEVNALSPTAPPGATSDSYTEWTFMTRESFRHNEDPLGEDHMERRYTRDTFADKERTFSATTGADSEESSTGVKSGVQVAPAPQVAQPPQAHVQHVEDIGLLEVLREQPPRPPK